MTNHHTFPSHFVFIVSDSMPDVLECACTSALGTQSSQDVLMIYWRQRRWNLSSNFCCLLCNVHASQSYSKESEQQPCRQPVLCSSSLFLTRFHSFPKEAPVDVTPLCPCRVLKSAGRGAVDLNCSGPRGGDTVLAEASLPSSYGSCSFCKAAGKVLQVSFTLCS